MARFDDNIPNESARSRATRENVDAETLVSARTGDDASAFFPAEGETTPVSGANYRDPAKEGAVQGTTDGLNGVVDARQGLGADSVPPVVGSDADGDVDNDGTPDV